MALVQLLRTSKMSLTCNTKNILLSRNYSSLIQSQLKTMTIARQANTLKMPSRQIFISSVKQVKDMSYLGHNHTTLWTLERAVTVALLGVIPLAFIIPSKPLDYLLAVSVVLHNHWGMAAVCTDYLRPNTVGPLLSKGAIGLCYLLSILTLAGLFKLINNNDVGLVGSLKKIWALPEKH